jgi:hypothetical protein
MAGNGINVTATKWILKCYWKTENANELQTRWRNVFGTLSRTCSPVSKLQRKFDNHVRVKYVNSGTSHDMLNNRSFSRYEPETQEESMKTARILSV